VTKIHHGDTQNTKRNQSRHSGAARSVEPESADVGDGSGFRAPPCGRPRNDITEKREYLSYYVYLLANRKDGTLYLGFTNDLVRRIYEHKNKVVSGFTARYGVDRLVWFECYDDPTSAITREKDIKKWRRAWKIRLIERCNPNWLDLYESIIH
jgi:putative endonuclease